MPNFTNNLIVVNNLARKIKFNVSELWLTYIIHERFKSYLLLYWLDFHNDFF